MTSEIGKDSSLLKNHVRQFFSKHSYQFLSPATSRHEILTSMYVAKISQEIVSKTQGYISSKRSK